MKLELEPVPLAASGNEITDAARAAARAWLATQLGGSTDGLPYSNYLALSGNEITDAKRTAALQGDGLLVPNGCGIWEAATNLHINGGCETNTTGWGAMPNSTVTRDNAHAKFGSWSLKIVTNGVATNEGSQASASAITVALGATYAVSMWVYSNAGGERVTINVDETSATLGYLTTWSGQSTLLVAGWNRLVMVGTTGKSPLVNSISVSLRTATTPQAITVWQDGVQVELRRAATTLTLSGNEITDVVRAADTQGDGRAYARVTNLVPNGGFETNTTGWAALNGGTLSRVTTDHQYGSACCQVVTPGVANNEGIQTSGAWAIVPGTTYTASAWVKAPAGALLRIRITDAVSSVDGPFTATGAWQRVSVTYTTQPTASVANVYVFTMTNAQAITFLVDGVQMEIGATANTYIETNGAAASQIQGTPDSSTAIWEGTTNLVKNGGAETDASNLGQNNCVVTSDGAIAKFGAKSFKVVANGAGAAGLYALYTAGGNPGSRVPVTAGATYCSSAWVYSPGASITIRPSFEWYDSTNTQNVTAATTGSAQLVPANTWTRVYVTGTAPANAAGCTPTMYTTTNPPNGTVWFVDGFQLEQRRGATVLAGSGNEIGDVQRRAAAAWLATQSGGSVDDNGFYFNLCGNPSFETDLSMWSIAGTAGTTVTRDSTKHQDGAWCQKIVTTGLSGQGAMYDPGLGLRPTCVPGQTMAASAWFAGNAGGEVVDVQLEWLDASGTGLGSATGTAITLTTGFSLATVTGVAPASAASCRLRCRSTNAATITFFLDAVQIEANAVHPYATRTGTIMNAGTHITRLATNLFRRGQCDSASDFTTYNGAGMTRTVDATNPAPFSPQSIKVVTDGTQANQGTSMFTASAQAAPTGQVAAGSVWFKGQAGASYSVQLRWSNTDVTLTYGTLTNFTATGTWQLLAAGSVAVAAGKTGDQINILVAVNGTRTDTFWVAHAMLESLTAAGTRSDITPYIATSGGTTANRNGSNGVTVAPSGILGSTVGWMAIRVRIAGPSGSNSGTLVSLDDGTLNNRISLTMSGASWQSRRVFGGVGGAVANISDTHVYGDTVTGVVKWDAANIAISINGAPFVSVANAGGAFTPSEVVLGGGAGAATVDGNVLWAMCGGGSLVDADAATLNALGNTDPSPDTTFGTTQATTLVWTADGLAYNVKNANFQAPTPYVETNGASAARGNSRAQLPATLMAPAQGWFACRLRMGFPSTADPFFGTAVRFAYLGKLTSDTDGRILLAWSPGQGFNVYRSAPGDTTGGRPFSGLAFNIGDLVTVVGYYTSTTCAISVNGGAFVTSANTKIPNVPTVFDLGTEGGATAWADSDMLWFMCGSGTLTNADATALNALGNTDPNVDTALGSGAAIKAVWSGDTAAYVIPGSNTQPATPYVETNGAPATRPDGRVQAPASLLTQTQGWVALRYVPGFTLGSAAQRSTGLFTWANDASNFYELYIAGNGALLISRKTAGVQTSKQWATTLTTPLGTPIVIVAYWTATQLGISVNGGPFQTGADTNVPTMTAPTFDIGSLLSWLAATQADGNILWFACGTGTLANADAAALGAMTSLPDKSLLPGAATAAINDLTAAYQTVGGQKNGFGIWEAGTNLFRRGQCDAATDWVAGGGVTVSVDATVPAPFSPQSIKVVTTGAGNSRCFAQSATGQAAAAGVVGVGSVWFKGTAGASYTAAMEWANTDASTSALGGITFAATGQWQLLTPGQNAVLAGKTGDALRISVTRNPSPFADTFWLAHAMIQKGVALTSPYVATSGSQAATRSVGRVQAPSSLLDATQGWFAARVKMGFASVAVAGLGSRQFGIAYWDDGAASEGWFLFYRAGTNDFRMRCEHLNGATGDAVIPAAFSPGDSVTVIGSWTDEQVAVSVNGSAFTRVAFIGAGVPTAQTFEIGGIRGNNNLDGNTLWFACGTGQLSNADAAYFHKTGDTGPASISQLPGTPTMLWIAVDANGHELVWVAPPRGQFEIARLPFAEAQAQLAGGGPVGMPQSAKVGWHGSQMDSDAGSFALVRSGGPFQDWVGKRVQITHQRGHGRSVYAFVAAETALIEDISLTRALFARMELLAADDIPALVQEVA